MSEPQPIPTNVLAVTVQGVGDFTFAKRTMRLEIKVTVERQRLSEGVALDEFQDAFITAMADLKVLLIDPPKGWTPDELDALDPYDDANYGRLLKVWSALRGKEETFRRARKAVPEGGEGAGG